MFAEGFSGVPEELAHKPLEFLYEQFSAYIEDRRRAAARRHHDEDGHGHLPRRHHARRCNDVALLAANLFTGGQETTVRLLSFALRILAERPDLQDRLRADRDLIPNFVEETLRYESPLRAQFRMAKVRTTVGGVDIPAGSTMLLLPGAANRDPRKFADPGTFDLERENAIYHLAFGHGIHHCAGAHLARAEGRVTINRLLDLTSGFSISEAAHGPADDRRWEYLPTYFLRGLRRLDLELTRRASSAVAVLAHPRRMPRREVPEHHRVGDARARPEVVAAHDRGGAVAGGVEPLDGLVVLVEHAGVLVGDEAAAGADVAGQHLAGVVGRLVDRAQAGVHLAVGIAQRPVVGGLAAAVVGVDALARRAR